MKPKNSTADLLSSVDILINEINEAQNIDLDKMICYVNGTIIAAYLIIFNILNFGGSQESLMLRLSLIVSILFFVLSLLTFIRHIIRFPKRMKSFGMNLKNKMKGPLEDFQFAIKEFGEKYLTPLAVFNATERINSGQNPEFVSQDVLNVVDDFFYNSTFGKILFDNYFNKMIASITKDTFMIPGKMPRFNYYLDRISEKTRYVFFVLGMSFFLIAIITFILIK